jgi:hypothetical protein
MSSKKRRPARAAARRTARPGQRQGRPSSVTSANPLVVAVITVIVTVILTAGASIPTGIYIGDRLHQGAANEAAVQAAHASLAAAESQDAELVDFGMGTDPKTGRPEVVIENRSSGFVRNVTLIVPAPVQATSNADGSTSVSLPNFASGFDGGSGSSGIVGTPDGIFYRDPLPDIAPCELAVTIVLRSLPSIQPGPTLAKAELGFTDPNGIAWVRFGTGKLVRNTGFKGPGAWSPYALEEPLPDCSAG